MNGEKALLRKRFLKIRSRIPEEEKKKESEGAMRQLSASRIFRDAEYVLAFYPLPEEIDLSGLRQLCRETGKRIAYPKVSGEEMAFYEVLPGDELTPGAFRVMEPSGKGAPAEWENAICLTPGVAFDGCGNRCGYGKGYYDRYFSSHPKLLRIGVCFLSQVSQTPIPTTELDQKVQYLLTERGIARCER